MERAGLTEVPVAGIDDEVDHGQREADRERRERRVLVAGVGDREDHQTNSAVSSSSRRNAAHQA